MFLANLLGAMLPRDMDFARFLHFRRWDGGFFFPHRGFLVIS